MLPKTGISLKSRKATLARIPFLADLLLDRQAGRGGGTVLRVFSIRRRRLRDTLNEMVDCGFLAHMPFVRAVRRLWHCDPPERLLIDT